MAWVASATGLCNAGSYYYCVVWLPPFPLLRQAKVSSSAAVLQIRDVTQCDSAESLRLMQAIARYGVVPEAPGGRPDDTSCAFSFLSSKQARQQMEVAWKRFWHESTQHTEGNNMHCQNKWVSITMQNGQRETNLPITQTNFPKHHSLFPESLPGSD